jgi:hypothetical protein
MSDVNTVAIRLGAQSAAPFVGSPGASEAALEIQRRRQPPTASKELGAVAELIMQPDSCPSQGAIDLASTWLPLIAARTAKLGGWQSPHITSTEQREIVCEWWRNDKKLTIYFGDENAEFIKVWGTDIDRDMESGELASEWDIVAAWCWLQS